MRQNHILWLAIAMLFSSTTVSVYAQSYTCAQEYYHNIRLAEDPEYKIQYEKINAQIYEIAKRKLDDEKLNRRSNSSTSRQIPIVIYIIHNSSHPTPGSGSSNPTDAQIMTGINHLNDAFANINEFAGHGHGANDVNNPDRSILQSVPTDIQFCLSSRDFYGEYSPGIYRIQSDTYSSLDIGMELADMKELINSQIGEGRFPESDYCPIFLTEQICSVSTGLGCGIAGYAGPSLGVLNLSSLWGSSVRNSKIHIHELGHYLNLSHTWSGGCDNNDCLLNGDRVCDTPPDNSTSSDDCSVNTNSCSTDTDASNSPFTTDQDDLSENYMDYSNRSCQNTFTQGQAVRMNASLDSRPSLLNSSGCMDCVSLNNSTSTPGTITDCLSSTTINLNVNNFTNVSSAPNRVVGWWVTKDAPISDLAINDITTQDALISATINEPLTANANVIFEGMGNDGAFSLEVPPTQLSTGSTYYITPFLSTKVIPTPTSNCNSTSGQLSNTLYNGFHAKSTNFNSENIDCEVEGVKPNYVMTITISGYTGEPDKLGINIRQNGDMNSLYTTYSASGNGTYTFSQDDLRHADPTNSNFKIYAWHYGGDGFLNGNIDASLNVTYPEVTEISFPNIPNYTSCTFGNPISFDFNCPNSCSSSSNIPTMPGTYNSTQFATEDGFNYYCDGSGNLLLAIDENTNIGSTDVEIKISSLHADFYPTGTGFIRADPGAAILPCTWDVNGAIINPATVRLFFVDNAISLINSAIPGTSDDVTSLTDLSFYKITNVDMSGHEDIANLTESDIQMITNGPIANISQWTLGTIGGKNYSEFQVSSFSGGGAGTGAGESNLLPVELITFHGKISGTSNHLFWSTASETNNDYFSIERSSDGQAFIEIGRINGAGNSQSESTYTYTDFTPKIKTNYYRIKQIDFDGKYEYSNIISLKNKNKEKDKLLLYPNPAKNNLRLDFSTDHSSTAYIKIIDTQGKSILTQQSILGIGNNSILLDITSLPTGAYILKLSYGEQTKISKLLISK